MVIHVTVMHWVARQWQGGSGQPNSRRCATVVGLVSPDLADSYDMLAQRKSLEGKSRSLNKDKVAEGRPRNLKVAI